MSNMVEVRIDSVRVHLMTPTRLVVLKHIDSERYIPIVVGPYEAEAITIALQEVEVSRPLTHDLLRNIFNAFGAQITRVEIVKLEHDTFFGAIIAELNGQTFEIDSRASDAIALSIRAHVPIYVHASVMEMASIAPDEEAAESSTAMLKAEPAPLSKEGVERLSVFEDFLEKLDFDKPDENKPEDNAPDKPKKPKKK
ncbi:MAG: bifunctional nuclease family protein [Anaerolineales bacterium]|nr:bifunctional nuclease family protein [Anaerolineales bacterium]MCL4260769.1 bifunctional nuclease family protein [Anaerolineales bacterium]